MGLGYLLDTNILSEAVKPRPNLKVIKHLEEYAGRYVTSSTVWHELLFGVQRMPDSKRKEQLSAYLDGLTLGGIIVLSYDKEAAIWLAEQRTRLSQQGIAASMADGEIAAVACTNKLILATRNVKDFAIFDDLIIENWFE